jgi:phage protein D
MPSRPTLAVDGTVRSDVSADLVALRYDDRGGTLELTLNNWSKAGYTYSEGTLFRTGASVALLVGSGSNQSKLVEGQITELAPNFTGTGTRTITIRAAAGAPQSPSSALHVEYGSTLHDFYAVLKADGSIACSGTVDDIGDLVRGMTVQVGGVGTRFSGKYVVSGTVHTLDSTHGTRTAFTATRAATRATLKTAPKAGADRAL